MKPSSSPADVVSTLRTRASLLRRVGDWRDEGSWREFHRLYHRLILGYARRRGLSQEDAEEVAQDVFRRVGETIHTFTPDPERGSFRGWLMTLVRWRVANKHARRPVDERRRAGSGRVVGEDGAGEGTATIERVPDPAAAGADEAWETEWRRHVLDAACARLARRVEARHFQAFELYVLRGRPVAEVAAELGLSAAGVYLVGHRLKRRLAAEAKRLRGEWE